MEIMPAHFEPRKRGRRPVFDLTPILADMDATGAKGQWLKYDLEEKHARSAKRQLDKLGISAAVEANEGGYQLYVKA